MFSSLILQFFRESGFANGCGHLLFSVLQLCFSFLLCLICGILMTLLCSDKRIVCTLKSAINPCFFTSVLFHLIMTYHTNFFILSTLQVNFILAKFTIQRWSDPPLYLFETKSSKKFGKHLCDCCFEGQKFTQKTAFCAFCYFVTIVYFESNDALMTLAMHDIPCNIHHYFN